MDKCRICGNYFSQRSFGGPGICPSCDCGLPPKSQPPWYYGTSSFALGEFNYDNIQAIIRSMDILRTDWKIPKRIVIRRDFLFKLIALDLLKSEKYYKGTLYGIPCEITEDPLAPNYSIDYTDA